MTTAKVKVFGHRGYHGEEWPLQSEFETSGGMVPTSGEGRERTPTCFFVFPLDYSGLDPTFPRAHYQHLMIAHNFNWDTRRGEYIHMPYGGKIEIEAL